MPVPAPSSESGLPLYPSRWAKRLLLTGEEKNGNIKRKLYPKLLYQNSLFNYSFLIFPYNVCMCSFPNLCLTTLWAAFMVPSALLAGPDLVVCEDSSKSSFSRHF